MKTDTIVTGDLKSLPMPELQTKLESSPEGLSQAGDQGTGEARWEVGHTGST